MESIEQKQDDAREHNGCVGHPITNMLMGGVPAGAAGGDADVIDLGAARAARAADAYVPEPDTLGGEVPAELMTEIEYFAGQANDVIRQVRDTDERTAHLVITCERLARGQVDMHAKLDRILNHFKVA